MKTQTINKEIIRLAVPNIISNVTVPLLGLADMAIMGHTGSVANIGAISLGNLIFSYLYWGFAFLRMGTSGITAQAFGKQAHKESAETLFRGLLLAAIGGIMLILFKKPIGTLALQILNAPLDVEQLTLQYYNVRIYAAPVAIANYAFGGWFIGMQNAFVPMLATIISNLANMALNYIFVFRFNMGPEGVALGTLISQYLSAGVYIYFYLSKYSAYTVNNWRRITNKAALSSFFSINGHIFLRTLCVILVLSFIQAESAIYGKDILAVSAIMQQFVLFFSFFIDGVAYAAEAITGKYYGQGNSERMRKAIKALFKWGTIITICYTLTYIILGKWMVHAITNLDEVRQAFKPFYLWMWLIPISSFAAFIWDGIYIGATKTKTMLVVMLVATFLIFFPVYFLFKNNLQSSALWLALMLFFFIRGILQGFLFRQKCFIRN